MTLRRTVGSLGSLHLFYGVDVIVFCEGGKSTELSEALKNGPQELTLDTIYWKHVINIVGGLKTYHVKSIGSKSVLLQIASDVAESRAGNITVCMDSDYDRALGRHFTHPRIAYTLGYSWESDVLSKEVLLDILRHLIGPPSTADASALCTSIDAFFTSVRRWVEYDIALRALAKGCVLDREKPLSCIDLDKSPPVLHDVRLSARLSALGYKRGPNRKVVVQPSEIRFLCFGRLVSKFVYHLVVDFAKRSNPKIRIDYDNFMRLAINETFKLIHTSSMKHLEVHHVKQAKCF